MWGVCKRNGDQPLLLQADISRRAVKANRPALFRLSSTYLTSLQSRSVNVSSKTRNSCGDQLKFACFGAPRDDLRVMAEHDCPIFLPQRSSKLSTSTTTIQNECELKTAPICLPHRRLGAKLCEYVPLLLLFAQKDILLDFDEVCSIWVFLLHYNSKTLFQSQQKFKQE